MYMARSFEQCRLLSSTVPVCVKDLTAVLGCLVVFCLLAFWIIPRILKRRRRSTCGDGRQAHDPFHVVSPMNDSLLLKHGIVPSPSKPEKVWTTGIPWMSTAYYSEPTPDLKYSTGSIGDPPPYTPPSFHQSPFVSSPKISSPRSSRVRGALNHHLTRFISSCRIYWPYPSCQRESLR
ncbi:hypothetical protein EDC04DRAFT_2781970 [Pisolithus marmoratus]|nr:hypothetical protein EDC04DRAFT_2781970 [Pisolithus marmoratus]